MGRRQRNKNTTTEKPLCWYVSKNVQIARKGVSKDLPPPLLIKDKTAIGVELYYFITLSLINPVMPFSIILETKSKF